MFLCILSFDDIGAVTILIKVWDSNASDHRLWVEPNSVISDHISDDQPPPMNILNRISFILLHL